MTTNTATLAETERHLAEAREALARALALEADASAAVDRDRESLALGAIVRKTLLGQQRTMARRTEETAQAASAVKAYERLAGAERERVAAAAHRVKVDRSAALRIAAAELEARIGAFLVDVRAEAEDLDRAVAAFNAAAAGTFAAPFRGLSNYGAWARVEDGLTVLGQFFKAPKRSTTPTTISVNSEKETPDVG